MLRLLALAAISALLACGSSSSMQSGSDAGVSACLERPTDLARPAASGSLPCELLPPR
ncbi:MAG TPA: hypothetical protein VMK66_16385 [Myxococcales bacterium]|nr:hypothetical protein [Myxococcales bacterium]